MLLVRIFLAGDEQGTLTLDEMSECSLPLIVTGKFFVVGTKLTSGRVGQRGIEVHFKCGAYGAHTFVMRTYSEYMRLARLEGGNFSVFNA